MKLSDCAHALAAEAAKTASMQEETARRRDLTSNLETIQAIRAGRGVGSGSPTAMAIYNTTIDKSEDDIATSKANYAAKADLAQRAAILSARKSSTSLLSGALGAASTIASGGYRYGSLNFPSGRAPGGRSIGDPTQIGGLY